MRIQLALLRHEWRLQTRSLRFYFGLALFAVALAPSVLAWKMAERAGVTLSPAVLLSETFSVLPFVTLVLAVIVAGNTARLHGERELLLSARISGFGFLTRKVVALATLVLPISLAVLAVPLLFPTLVWAEPPSAEVVDSAIWRWLFEVAPRALLGIVGWLALTRVFRHEVGAFIAAVFGTRLLLTGLNQALFFLRVRVDPGDWSGFTSAGSWIGMIPYRLEDPERALPTFPYSEAPFPVDLALQSLAATLPIVLAFGLAAFLAGALVLGRSAADSPPLGLAPDHPIRTLALGADRVRAALRPDAGLTPREWGAAAVAILLVVLLASVPVVRSRFFLSLLEERYEAEWQAPGEVTSPDLEPHRIILRGRLDADGQVEIESALFFHHSGASPIEHLAFELNRGLQVAWEDSVPARAPTARSWDRLEVDLEAPIAPGAEPVLSLRARGVPADYEIPLIGWNQAPFPDRYEALLAARFPREISHLRNARVAPQAADRVIRLGLSSLAPRPRYTSWQPIVSDTPGQHGRHILPEQHDPPVTVEVDLQLPSKWFLADPCGHVSVPEPNTGRARLRATCRVPLSDWVLLGGDHRPVSISEQAIVASRARRGTRIQELLGAMDRVAELSGRAWPGIEPVERLVAVEVPPPFGDTNRFAAIPPIEIYGTLLEVPELQLSHAAERIDERQLVASIITPRLPDPRVVETQELLADQLLTAVLMQRMGLSGRTAAMTGRPWDRGALRRPLLGAQIHDQITWAQRLPAVLFALESRVGATPLVDTLDEFLQSKPGETGERDLRDWLGQLEARTGTDLDDLWRDYVAGNGLPELRVENVDVRRAGDGFSVRGTLVNDGTGEVRCPIVVKSEREEVETLVTIEDGTPTPFALRTKARPHTLLLDPRGTCLRFRALNAKESFRLMEGT